MKIYGLKNCDKCRQASKILLNSGQEVSFIDVRSDGISLKLLENFYSIFGVELVNNSKQKNRLIENKEKDTYKRKAINFLRRLKLNNEEFDIYSYNKKKFSGFVIQDFIEGLEFDYKILVFWGKFYVLKRNIKKGDFRASGSGLFEFKEPSNAVLNYAKYIFETLDTPYASLDIAESYVGCKLIEYQALNFGPYALIKSPGYYTLNDGYWVFIEVTSSLEVEFSRSLAAYVSNM